MRRHLASLSIFAALLGAGCAKPPMGLYCEGGVRDGNPDGGECLRISAEKVDADPTSVGSANRDGSYVRSSDRYSVRRVGKHAYKLFMKGELAGTLEEDGNWIHVKLVSESREFRMRSDLPGILN